MSSTFQTKENESRKRQNFGYQRFNCNGSLFIHQNDSCITIMIRHDIEHKSINKNLELGLIQQIEEMCLRASPAHIFKELKARESQERIISLTLKQVNKII